LVECKSLVPLEIAVVEKEHEELILLEMVEDAPILDISLGVKLPLWVFDIILVQLGPIFDSPEM